MHDLVPLEYGQYYHIYNRGNSGENIFDSPEKRPFSPPRHKDTKDFQGFAQENSDSTSLWRII